ncbi:hypothetical protein BDZ89DRAFT_380356 [Hymenopellis radicata]|nr:hypothetical protein BDZ89DRAFT_380356 [Hymenopellis radicata]
MSSTTTPHSPPVETSELVCSCVQSAACACLREAHYDGPHDHAIQTEVDDAHTVVPTHYAEPRRHTRRKCMSLSKGRPRAERGNDPYDYELKFPEDEPFKEMGPMARVWKTFLEEYAKFDSDRVEDWRDALDVLLVFAGLFSAVVTTFVAQTSQSLQLDYGEVAAHLMWEMIHLQRAMMDGAPSSSVARSNISPTSPVRVSRTNAWVNALWFTSLALSLTTALMAVLTKQWIHQYMAVPSGTPCDRSRIRQYRFENIDKWHVPLIIGILPVLMHFALGIFFFGLVIYVRALSTPTASVVGVIAFIAFMAYFGTTLLPVFKPDCPYKTYLTLYSYSLFAYMRVMYHRCFNLVRNWTHKRIRIRAQPVQDETPSLDFPMYIKEVEKRTVADMAGSLEVRALVGLYNISSNTSVQRIVLQAASILPLEFLSALKHGIPDVAQRIRLLVESMEYTAPDKQTAYERLYRAHVRFEDPIPKPSFVEPDVWTPSLAHAIRSPNALSLLVDGSRPEQAIAFLREQIMLKDSYQNFDVYVQ